MDKIGGLLLLILGLFLGAISESYVINKYKDNVAKKAKENQCRCTAEECAAYSSGKR